MTHQKRGVRYARAASRPSNAVLPFDAEADITEVRESRLRRNSANIQDECLKSEGRGVGGRGGNMNM